LGIESSEFWILDCPFSIGGKSDAQHIAEPFFEFFLQESKTQNRKWLGLSVIAFVLVAGGAVGAAASKSSADWLFV
jgi:hypothetical protein